MLACQKPYRAAKWISSPDDLRRIHLSGAVSVHLPDALLEEVVTQLLAQLSSGGTLKADLVRTYMQALGQVR